MCQWGNHRVHGEKTEYTNGNCRYRTYGKEESRGTIIRPSPDAIKESAWAGDRTTSSLIPST